jgi:hypothetical protein
MENNRYEEVEKKQNKFVLALKGFGKYIARVWKDFIASFRYNNMKLAGWLIAVPGIFIGFFLQWHAPVVKQMAFNHSVFIKGSLREVNELGFDYTGIILFVLMLAGILNIFGAASVIGKKNLGSVVRATIFTGIIVVCAALYLYAIFFYNSLVQKGTIKVKVEGWSIWQDTNFIMAIISILVSVVSAVIGCVLGFIKYDRTYEKVDR